MTSRIKFTPAETVKGQILFYGFFNSLLLPRSLSQRYERHGFMLSLGSGITLKSNPTLSFAQQGYPNCGETKVHVRVKRYKFTIDLSA